MNQCKPPTSLLKLNEYQNDKIKQTLDVLPKKKIIIIIGL